MHWIDNDHVASDKKDTSTLRHVTAETTTAINDICTWHDPTTTTVLTQLTAGIWSGVPVPWGPTRRVSVAEWGRRHVALSLSRQSIISWCRWSEVWLQVWSIAFSVMVNISVICVKRSAANEKKYCDAFCKCFTTMSTVNQLWLADWCRQWHNVNLVSTGAVCMTRS